MLRIGCHLSASKGFYHMGKEAVSIGANTFQFFTRNPRGGSAKPLDLQDIEKYLEFAKKNGIEKILAHAPYTLNSCAQKEGLREFALETMRDDMQRLEHIPGGLYNFHPGSHVGQGEEKGIELIADLLNRLLEESFSTRILLETMAGKGTEIGRNFEEIRSIMDKVEQKERLGVCMDTCHVFDGGYDVVDHLEEVLKNFDEVIGVTCLYAVHLNDSMNPIGSHKDRHQKIGEGYIGTEAFARIINHPALRHLPFFLETPNELPGYEKEIALLKNLYRRCNYVNDSGN